MAAIIDIVPEPSPVRLLLGSDVDIVDTRYWKVNRHLHIKCWSLNHPQQKLPQTQFAKIVCDKVNNGAYAVQLLYLKRYATPQTTAIVFAVCFDPAFLAQWEEQDIIDEDAFNENSSGLQFAFCNEAQQAINDLLTFSAETSFAEKLRQLELSAVLLRRSIFHVNESNNTYSVPACSFLNNTTEREKVIQAHYILSREFEQMLTIKEISKRVAINECYLKKGFKAMFGKTINEFQQHLRIEKAKTLLQTEGYSVSDVANVLGYSSISHFSTAFKKATSMKPCELLK